MQYELKEAVTLNVNQARPSKSKNHSLRKARMKKFMLNKVLPVGVHIISLLIGLGIIIIISHFAD